MKCTKCEKEHEKLKAFCPNCLEQKLDEQYEAGCDGGHQGLISDALTGLCKILTGKTPNQLTAADEAKWPGVTQAAQP